MYLDQASTSTSGIGFKVHEQAKHRSVRSVAQYTGLSVGLVRKILKHNEFHPYKIQVLRELNEDDPDRTLHVCEIIVNVMGRIYDDYLRRACFSDGRCLILHGSVNRHNGKFWPNKNPRWIH